MTEQSGDGIVVRFLMDLPTEDPTYVYLKFKDAGQAEDAINNVLGADEAIMIETAGSTPALIHAGRVLAAYPLEFANYEYELEYENEEEEEEEE